MRGLFVGAASRGKLVPAGGGGQIADTQKRPANRAFCIDLINERGK